VNGSVTTATVSALSDFAISAATGAEPVPVPPPSPQVMKTKSDPFSTSVISSPLSLAALSPIAGSLPAPSPLVNFLPIRIFLLILLLKGPARLCLALK